MEVVMERNIPEHKFLDAVKREFKLKNDAAVGKFLGITNPAISKIRHGKLKIGAVHILRAYDATGWSIEKIREHLG